LSLGRRLAFVVLLAFSVSVARADQAGPPDDPSAHVFNYGKAHPQCARWTDGCRTCAADGCSNIGIACQPNEIRCLLDATRPPGTADGSHKPESQTHY
jgi:hypothetical protein